MILNFFDEEIRPHWIYRDAGAFVYFAWKDFTLLRSSDSFAHEYSLYKHVFLKGAHGIEIKRDEFRELLSCPSFELQTFYEKESTALVRCPYGCDDDPTDIEGLSCGECGGYGSVRKRTFFHIDYWTKGKG